VMEKYGSQAGLVTQCVVQKHGAAAGDKEDVAGAMGCQTSGKVGGDRTH
jgi:hypothetical protein